MSRRKQARPRSCRESLEDGSEISNPEGILGEGKLSGGGITMETDNLQTEGNNTGVSDQAMRAGHDTMPMPTPSPASMYSTSPSPSLMDSEPMSPSLAALTPEEVPFSDHVNETHPYGCKFCEKAFSHTVYLQKHEQLHQDYLPFQCVICGRSFKHKRSRERHMKIHACDKKYKCAQCPATFPRHEYLKIHQKNHELGRPFSCVVCNWGFTTVGALATHLSTHKTEGPSILDASKTFSCPVCGEDFVTVEGLQLHIAQHTEASMDNSGKDFYDVSALRNTCPLCAETFSTMEELMDHMMLHNAGTFALVSPNRPLSTSSAVSQNGADQLVSPVQVVGQVEEKNVCPYCYREDFLTLEMLEIHMQSVHSVKPTDVYTCNYCNAPYPNLYSLHEHMRVIHKNQPCLDIKYPCNFCSQEFSSIELLAEHRHLKHSRLVSSPQQHKQIMEAITCMQCSMVFENPTMLQNHLILVHGKHVKHEVKTPGKRPKVSSHLGSSGTKHLRTALFSSRPPSQNGTDMSLGSGVTCDQCNATFGNLEDFQCHMKLHHNPAGGRSVPGGHRCGICNEDFPTSDLLDAHAFVHFLHQTTEYGCTPCAKIFHKPDELQKHLMDIHAHHLYRCSLCKEIFDSKVNIQVHFAIKHSNECKLFKCTECSTVFRSEMEWQLHVKVSHLQIAKPYRCLFCRDSFATEMELQCHLTTHKKSFHCTMCSDSFHVEYLLDRHLQEVHNPEKHLTTETVQIKVEKDICQINVTSTTPSSLHPTKSPEPSTSNSLWKAMETCVWYTCNICDAKFNQPAALQLHKLQEHQQKICSAASKQTSPRSFPSISTPSPVIDSSSSRKVCSNETMKSPHQTSVEQTEAEKLSHGCCFCSQTFRSKNEMDKHMKIHVNSGGQKCNICDEVFTSTNVLAEHKLQHCKVPQGNVCVGCKKILKTEEQFYNHSQEHGVQGSMMQCVICRQSLASMIELQMHGKHHFQVKPSFYTCCVCLKTYDTRENLISKLNASGRNYYVCKPCYHGETAQHICHQCQATFSSQDLLSAHSQTHHKSYQCIKCQESFSSEYEIQIHVATHMMQEGNIHECKLCLKTFESPAKLQCHLIEHTYISREMRCHVCGAVFMRAVDIQAHAVEHGISARSYSCSQCNQKFFFSAELENHLLGHTGDGSSSSSSETSPSDLECPDCNLTFPDLAHLTSHRKTHDHSEAHSGFQCSLCSEDFTEMSELQTHFFSTHTDSMSIPHDSGLSCTECLQGFPNTALLQAHKKLHTTGAKHTCPVCMKVFAVSRNLHIHLRSHGAEKPYECPICKKRFSRKENRKAHMKSHCDVKPFICPICGKGFSRRSHVKDHMRVHFAKDPTNLSLLERLHEVDTGSTSDTLSPASDGAPWKSNNTDETGGHSLATWTGVDDEEEACEKIHSEDYENRGEKSSPVSS